MVVEFAQSQRPGHDRSCFSQFLLCAHDVAAGHWFTSFVDPGWRGRARRGGPHFHVIPDKLPVLGGGALGNRISGSDRGFVLRAVETEGPQPTGEGLFAVFACGLSFAARTRLQSWGVSFEVFQPVTTAVGYAGRCSVPLLLMALGAKVDSISAEIWGRGGPGEPKANYQALLIPSIASGGQNADSDSESGTSGTAGTGSVDPKAKSEVNGNEVPSMPLRGHLAVLLLRQLFGALLGLLMAYLVRRFCGVTDHVVLMTLLLQSCGPPMINLSVMAGVSGSAQRDSAKLLLVTYAASVFTWVIWTTIYLSWL